MLRKSALPRQKVLLLAIGCALAISLFTPNPAQAWWVRGGWGWRPGFAVGVVVPPPVVVGPPVVYAPPPVAYVPAPVVADPYRRHWVPAHYNWRGFWVPGHWA